METIEQQNETTPKKQKDFRWNQLCSEKKFISRWQKAKNVHELEEYFNKPTWTINRHAAYLRKIGIPLKILRRQKLSGISIHDLIKHAKKFNQYPKAI